MDRFTRASLVYKGTTRGFSVEIPFFDETLVLTIPDFVFKSARGSNINLVSRIIALHYINTATGVPLSGEKITYEDIPGLRGYQAVFERKAARPLANAFGFDRHMFLESGIALGAMEDDFGNASFTLRALPMVPITFILWEGDSEFPPSVKILFDLSIREYLPLEDITVISKMASTRILKTARLKYAGDSEDFY